MRASESHEASRPAPPQRRSYARLAAVMLGVAAVVAAIAWAVLDTHVRRADVRPATTAGTSSTSAASSMANMPGMDMSSGSTPAATNGAVTLTAAQLRQFGVTFGTAEVRTLTNEMRATGVVMVNETRVSQVTPKFAGFVERLYVNATGQHVARGQALLDVYSPELVAAQQELLSAGQLDREIGRSAVPGVPGSTSDLVAAARRRLQLWDISDAQIAEVLRTGRPRRTLTLHAPASGVVLEKRVLQGQAITAGEPLYTIADLSDVWIDVQLRGADAAAIRPGTGADVELTGVAGRLKGRVAYVYPTIDSASRALRARVVVSNTDGTLKPGMYAAVRLSTPSRAALTVPASAVLRAGDRDVVFIDAGGGVLQPHEVELGRTAGELVEVIGGVEAGQRVVTSAQFLLDSESNLGEVMRSMIAQSGSGDRAATSGMQNMPGMK